MKIKLFITAFIYFAMSTNIPFDASIGTTVSNIKLKNSLDKEMELPFFGEKVLAVFYNDPDSKDVNDPLSDALKAHKFPKEKYAGIGIANCAETWLPNSLIRHGVKEKELKYPGAIILIDADKVLAKAWSLGSCDDNSCILIIGKDRKIKFISHVKNQEESKAIIPNVIKIVEAEIAKIN